MLSITAEARDASQKLDTLRSSGTMPAVFYGPKDDTVSVAVSLSEFKKVWDEAGESSVISLKTPAGDKEALIHDVDVHPVSGEPRHADFYIIEAGKTVEVEVPLTFVGVSPAEKSLGGVLVKVIHELSIEAMPKDLPQEIEVDISTLVDFDSQIAIKDITLPSGVTALGNPDDVVAVVNEAKEEEESESAAPDMDSIEVEQKGKQEEAPAEGEEKKD